MRVILGLQDDEKMRETPMAEPARHMVNHLTESP